MEVEIKIKDKETKEENKKPKKHPPMNVEIEDLPD